MDEVGAPAARRAQHRRGIVLTVVIAIVTAAGLGVNAFAQTASRHHASDVRRSLDRKLRSLTFADALKSATQTGNYTLYAVGGDMVQAGLSPTGVSFYNDPGPKWAFWISRCVVGNVATDGHVTTSIVAKKCP